MSDLSEYFSDKDRIKELELEVKLLTKKLKLEVGYKSKYKLKWLEMKPITRGEKALLLIEQLKSTDNPIKLIRAIAKKCYLSEVYVSELWYSN